MLLAVLSVAVCASFATAQETTLDPYWPCPNPDEFAPCLCILEDDSPDMDIDCSAATDQSMLTAAFQATMSFCNYMSLKITPIDTANYYTFTLDTFGCAYFETIEITGTTLQIIEDGALVRSDGTLTSLKLNNNMIRVFPFESLNGFTALQELYLNNNSLTTIQSIVSPTLQTLNLDNNPGLDISLGLFEDAKELQTLGLSSCNLADLTEDMFMPLEKLANLDLSGNMLEELRLSSIRLPMDTLTSLNMSGNPLDYIQVGAISGLNYPDVSLVFSQTEIILLDEAAWSVYFTNITDGGIDLAGTPLRCGCDIAWLFTEAQLITKLTDTTQCSDGTQVQGLDPCVFYMHCDDGDTVVCTHFGRTHDHLLQ